VRTQAEKEQRRIWDAKNKDRNRASRRKWYYKYRTRILLERKAYNPKRNIVLKLRRAKYPECVKADNHRRRLLTSNLIAQTIQLVYEDNIKRYGTLTCYLCEHPILFGKDHLEHRTPLSRGGTNEYYNLAIACQGCNCRKHDKTEEEYRRAINGSLTQSSL